MIGTRVIRIYTKPHTIRDYPANIGFFFFFNKKRAEDEINKKATRSFTRSIRTCYKAAYIIPEEICQAMPGISYSLARIGEMLKNFPATLRA